MFVVSGANYSTCPLALQVLGSGSLPVPVVAVPVAKVAFVALIVLLLDSINNTNPPHNL